MDEYQRWKNWKLSGVQLIAVCSNWSDLIVQGVLLCDAGRIIGIT